MRTINTCTRPYNTKRPGCCTWASYRSRTCRFDMFAVQNDCAS